ncbi:MAG: regulatory protein RecX [Candidatus Omnitrophota bacterium]
MRSEKEIRERLKKKIFNSETIESTVSFLKDRGFIDDNYFARAWIGSRIKKPLGIRRLKRELSIKGVDKAVIDTQINEIKQDYSEEDVVRGIVKSRLNRLKEIDPQKAKKRVYAYLMRRGFSPETIIDVLNE